MIYNTVSYPKKKKAVAGAPNLVLVREWLIWHLTVWFAVERYITEAAEIRRAMLPVELIKRVGTSFFLLFGFS